MFLVPAAGVPSELMLQDTLKSAIAAFGILIAALVFFWQQRNRTAPLLWHGMVWLPLVLMTYALGSMVWSHTYLAGVEAIRWFLLSLLLWLGLNTITRDNVRVLLWGIHAGAVVASLWVALQFWFDLKWFPQAAPPGSTFVNRNFFAEYTVSVLPLSFWLLISMPAARKLLAMAASIALCVLAILMTGTRSALVAMLVITPVLAFIAIRYRNAPGVFLWTKAQCAGIAGVFVLGIAGLGLIPTGNPNLGSGATPLGFGLSRTASVAKPSEYSEGSFSMRAVMWKATARMMIAQPLTGVGAGAWEVQIPLFQRVDSVLENDYYAHNEPLQFLSEYGLVVGGFFLACLLAQLLYAAGITARLGTAHQQEGALRAIVLCSTLILLIVSNAGFPLHLAACGCIFSLNLALLASSDVRLHFAPQRSTLLWRTTPSQMAFALVLNVCCIGFASYATFQAYRAEKSLVRAIELAYRYGKAEQSGDPTAGATKDLALESVKTGVAINPHYRRLTAIAAEPFAARGDWRNAVWILETLVASRPHVAALWTALAKGYSRLGQHGPATQAMQQVKRLKPNRISTHSLEARLLAEAGHFTKATELINSYYDQGKFDYDMVQVGYEISYKTHDWPLAIRSLELRNRVWPQFAADGHLRLGKIYAEPTLGDKAKALIEFKKGLDAVPAEQKENFRSQVPIQFRAQM